MESAQGKHTTDPPYKGMPAFLLQTLFLAHTSPLTLLCNWKTGCLMNLGSCLSEGTPARVGPPEAALKRRMSEGHLPSVEQPQKRYKPAEMPTSVIQTVDSHSPLGFWGIKTLVPGLRLQL
jgi:hypothetical protein